MKAVSGGYVARAFYSKQSSFVKSRRLLDGLKTGSVRSSLPVFAFSYYINIFSLAA